MATAQAAKNHRHKWGLTWYLWLGIYIYILHIYVYMYIYINPHLDPIIKFHNSSRSNKFKDILPWTISQMIIKTVPISTRIAIRHVMKKLYFKLYGPFLWMGFNCLKATATSRRQFTFHHSVPRNSWYSFYRPQKDKRLSRPWSHREIPYWFSWKVNGNWKNTWSGFPNGEKAITVHILASEEIYKFKRAGLWMSQSSIQVGKLITWVR